MVEKIDWHPNGTPGPWVVNPYCAQVDCGELDTEGDPLPVARMLWPTKWRSEDVTETNARAMAEAPAMVQALRDVYEYCHHLETEHAADAMRNVRAILARIDGDAA